MQDHESQGRCRPSLDPQVDYVPKGLVQSYEHSVSLHAMRAAALQHEVCHLSQQLHALRGGEAQPSWFLTRARSLKNFSRNVYGLYQREGMNGVGVRIGRRVKKYSAALGITHGREADKAAPVLQESFVTQTRRNEDDVRATYERKVGRALVSPSVLIIAELSVPQCAKYRVWQKVEEFHELGWQCHVVDWRDVESVFTGLQFCTDVIFYRTPAFESILRFIEEARRLSLSPWWEVDDLIFDYEEYTKNGNIASLPKEEKDAVIMGIELFRNCMLECGRGIASTEALAQAMRDAGLKEVFVVENALDKETIETAQALRGTKRLSEEDGIVRIVYGSGTNTHNADFEVAARGILAALKKDPNLRLQLIGQLDLPDYFAEVEGQVEYMSGRDYRAYLALLAQADIAIAPLEQTLFNDAKSNIKYLEASAVRLPSVCSPSKAFADFIKDGETGFLARTEEEWEEKLLRLASDKGLRETMAQKAEATVLAHYNPRNIAHSQLERIFGRPVEPAHDRLRVLVANVYFAPRSFGGATIIAEEMAERLHERPDMEVQVLTSRADIVGRPNSFLRYELDGMPVFGVNIPPGGDNVLSFDNPYILEGLGRYLDTWRPDVVHVHSIQGLGVGLLRLCQERGIPYVITLHDAWWLCERQFMVKGNGQYCFQREIDLKVCKRCIPGALHLEQRSFITHQILHEAAALLSPSAVHRDIYIANGVPAEKVRVHRNGVLFPDKPRPPRKAGPLRFGFAGGAELVKGYPLLKEAFEALDRADWELVIVDNKLNVGYRSIFVDDWKVKGTIKVTPAYSPENMDDFFYGIDVLLFPSQWRESYGLTVREALARDVWVVATGPGGQSEDIKDGVNGNCIPLDGQSDSLLAAIEALLEEPDRFNNYSNPCKDQIANYEQQVEELVTVLHNAARGELP